MGRVAVVVVGIAVAACLLLLGDEIITKSSAVSILAFCACVCCQIINQSGDVSVHRFVRGGRLLIPSGNVTVVRWCDAGGMHAPVGCTC